MASAEEPAAREWHTTTEIVEKILANLGMKDIMRAEGVNKFFKNVILGSTRLCRHIFLNAASRGKEVIAMLPAQKNEGEDSTFSNGTARCGWNNISLRLIHPCLENGGNDQGMRQVTMDRTQIHTSHISRGTNTSMTIPIYRPSKMTRIAMRMSRNHLLRLSL